LLEPVLGPDIPGVGHEHVEVENFAYGVYYSFDSRVQEASDGTETNDPEVYLLGLAIRLEDLQNVWNPFYLKR
jgi:hypothetical protein